MATNETLYVLIRWLIECEKADKYISFNPGQLIKKIADIEAAGVLELEESIPVVPVRDYSEVK